MSDQQQKFLRELRLVLISAGLGLIITLGGTFTAFYFRTSNFMDWMEKEVNKNTQEIKLKENKTDHDRDVDRIYNDMDRLKNHE